MQKLTLAFGIAPFAVVLALVIAIGVSSQNGAISPMEAGYYVSSWTVASSMLPSEFWDMI